MKKTYHVFEEGNHEYTIIEKETPNGRKISLFYSDNEQWTSHTRGELAMKMVVTGNGVKFSKNSKNLDYSELHYMRLLMNYERETDSNDYNKIKSQIYFVGDENSFEV
jgi:hypothetical protein